MSQHPQSHGPEIEIRTLIEEAAKELQTDQLKKELTAKIQGDKSRSLGSIAAHPAFLVIVGFIFTGVFGTIITSRWQSREWDRQQARLLQIRRIEQKEKIMESLTQTIAENCATTEDVLIAFDPGWRTDEPDHEDITKERIKTWRTKGGSDWRVTRESLRSKLDFYFTDPQLMELFEKVFDKNGTREEITTKMGVLVKQYFKDPNVRSKDEFQDGVGECSELIEKNRRDLRSMNRLILQDIQRDAAVPRSIWDYLR